MAETMLMAPRVTFTAKQGVPDNSEIYKWWVKSAIKMIMEIGTPSNQSKIERMGNLRNRNHIR